MYYEKYNTICKQTNTSNYEVSKNTGINAATFTNWKQGKYTPKIDTLKLIAAYFKVPVTYFTGEDKLFDMTVYDPRIYDIIRLFPQMTDKQKDLIIKLSKEFVDANK